MLLLLLMQTDTVPGRSRMYKHIGFSLVCSLQAKLHLYPDQIRCIGFGSHNNSPSLTLIIEGIIVGLIIVIKVNIQYALPHR